jgi:hypothetical protein
MQTYNAGRESLSVASTWHKTRRNVSLDSKGPAEFHYIVVAYRDFKNYRVQDEPVR